MISAKIPLIPSQKQAQNSQKAPKMQSEIDNRCQNPSIKDLDLSNNVTIFGFLKVR